MPRAELPLTVIIVTRNEEARLPVCLAALAGFNNVMIVDSNSTDATREIAVAAGAEYVNFTWNGEYPKKRQWCLDNLILLYDWVLFIDADEIMTPALFKEIVSLFQNAPSCAGYFIKGRYLQDGRLLKYGFCNNKIALFDRTKMMFPQVNDLDLPGMGEIEGHYQPVLRPVHAEEKTGALRHYLIHDAGSAAMSWRARHERYARWEAGMNKRQAWPRDPVKGRQRLKVLFRRMPGRGMIAFLHCYVLKRGFLDGKPGWQFACSRAYYYRMVERLTRTLL